MTWTQEMCDIFDVRFKAGDSYPQIAFAIKRKFPGVELTRSAMCGYAFRNGYRRGRVVAKPRPRKSRAKKQLSPNKLKAAELKNQQDDLGISEMEEGQTLMNQPCWFGLFDKSIALEQLNDLSCRWPLEVDECSSYRFCINKKGRGAYCLAHGDLAYARVRAPNKDHTYFPRRWGR